MKKNTQSISIFQVHFFRWVICLQIFIKIHKPFFKNMLGQIMSTDGGNDKVNQKKTPDKMSVKWRRINQAIWIFRSHIYRWWVMRVQIFIRFNAPFSQNMRGQNYVHRQGVQSDRWTNRWTRWIQYTTPQISYAGV